MIEIWKKIENIDGNYEISNTGKVKRNSYQKKTVDGIITTVPERISFGHENAGGYLIYTFNRNGKKINKLIHRLVAEAFIPNPENKPQVDHIDTNIKNNIVTNLRWATAYENSNNPLTIENNRRRQKMLRHY